MLHEPDEKRIERRTEERLVDVELVDPRPHPREGVLAFIEVREPVDGEAVKVSDDGGRGQIKEPRTLHDPRPMSSRNAIASIFSEPKNRSAKPWTVARNSSIFSSRSRTTARSAVGTPPASSLSRRSRHSLSAATM